MSPTKQAKSQWLRKAKKGNSVALVLPKAKKTWENLGSVRTIGCKKLCMIMITP